MNKSTFFMVEANSKLNLKDLQEIEDAIHKVLAKKGVTAVVSNMEYKKGAYF